MNNVFIAKALCFDSKLWGYKPDLIGDKMIQGIFWKNQFLTKILLKSPPLILGKTTI